MCYTLVTKTFTEALEDADSFLPLLVGISVSWGHGLETDLTALG